MKKKSINSICKQSLLSCIAALSFSLIVSTSSARAAGVGSEKATGFEAASARKKVTPSHNDSKTDKATDTFFIEVTGIKGPSFYRKPHSIKWHPLKKGDFILENSMMYVPENSLLGVKVGLPTKLGMEEKKLAFNRPIIIRAEPSMLRRIELSEMFFEDVAKTLKSKEDSDHIGLDAAWNQIKLVFKSVNQKTVNLFNDNPKKEKKTKPIRVLSPHDHQTVYLAEFPGKITVSWDTDTENIDTPKEYEVFFWRKTDTVPKKGFLTGESSYSLNIIRPGIHLVKVKSKDGSYESPAHSIVVKSKLQLLTQKNETKDQKETGDVSVSKESVFKTLHPPAKATIYTSKNDPTVIFKWQDIDSSQGYKLEIVDKSKDERRTFQIKDESHFTTTLPQGSYLWKVTAFIDQDTFFESEKQRFSIEPKPNLMSVIKTMSFERSNSIIWSP